jgi:hypothetical protein
LKPPIYQLIFRIYHKQMATKFLSNCTKLRDLMNHDCVSLPGAFNGQVGRLAAEAGIP